MGLLSTLISFLLWRSTHVLSPEPVSSFSDVAINGAAYHSGLRCLMDGLIDRLGSSWHIALSTEKEWGHKLKRLLPAKHSPLDSL